MAHLCYGGGSARTAPGSGRRDERVHGAQLVEQPGADAFKARAPRSQFDCNLRRVAEALRLRELRFALP